MEQQDWCRMYISVLETARDESAATEWLRGCGEIEASGSLPLSLAAILFRFQPFVKKLHWQNNHTVFPQILTSKLPLLDYCVRMYKTYYLMNIILPMK